MLNQNFHNFLLQKGIHSNYSETIGSTNEWAKSNVNEDQNLVHAFLADEQTKGKGRFDRNWSDGSDGGQIFSSWRFPIQSPHMLYPSIVGSFLHEELKVLCPDLQLKIPNDLYLKNKKVAGILCEMISKTNSHQLIVGLGINVFSHPTLDTAGKLDIANDNIDDLFNAVLNAIQKTQNFSLSAISERIQYLQSFAYVKNQEAILQIDEEFTITTKQNTYSWSEI
jgi:biotin-[acetyl-CoA-carboxylase] ligase BirA-like protein